MSLIDASTSFLSIWLASMLSVSVFLISSHRMITVLAALFEVFKVSAMLSHPSGSVSAAELPKNKSLAAVCPSFVNRFSSFSVHVHRHSQFGSEHSWEASQSIWWWQHAHASRISTEATLANTCGMYGNEASVSQSFPLVFPLIGYKYSQSLFIHLLLLTRLNQWNR